MATFQINDMEWSALSELSMLARNVYFVLRRYMDFKTGLTGKVYFVSLDTIIKELSIPAKRGSSGYIPSVKEIRVALDSLEKNSLISRDSKKNKADKHAIYKLNLADFDDANLGNSRAKNNGSICGKDKSTNNGKEDIKPQNTNAKASQYINTENYGKEESQNNGSIYGKANPPNLGDIPLYPIYNTTHNGRAREKYPMSLDWFPPDKSTLRLLLLNAGLPKNTIIDFDVISEYRGFWAGRPDVYKTTHEWTRGLVVQFKNKLQRGKANANNQRNNSQGKESLIERVNRKLDEWAS